MMITGNEVAVDNQLRRAEKQNQSPVNRLLDGAESTAQTMHLATGSVAIGRVAQALGIARRFTSGLGVATLSENLDHLGDATEAALSRVEKNLEAQGFRIEEIERRLNSNEFLEGIKAATLQAQRTKDKKRLERMALILANGVAENDLEPESLDDMMRTAVELKEIDLILLAEMYQMQSSYMRTDHWLSKQIKEKWNILSGYWQKYWDQNQTKYRGLEGERLMGSFARLESLGLIAPGPNRSSASSPVASCYLLLPDGMKFCERLQEIGSAK